MKNWKHLCWTFAWGLLASVSLLACEEKIEEIPEVWEGPIISAYNDVTKYSDLAKVRIVIKGKVVNQFKNGNLNYPEGIFIKFYDPEGILTTTLEADRATFNKEVNEFKVESGVKVINIENQEELVTEELIYEPNEKQFTTDKFVTIKTKTDLWHGTGLLANQDFSIWEITNAKGEINQKPIIKEDSVL